jgi:hypothetical protein
MDLIAEKSRVVLYESLPGKRIVYDMAYAALSGRDTDERQRAVTALGKSDDPRAFAADQYEDPALRHITPIS